MPSSCLRILAQRDLRAVEQVSGDRRLRALAVAPPRAILSLFHHVQHVLLVIGLFVAAGLLYIFDIVILATACGNILCIQLLFGDLLDGCLAFEGIVHVEESVAASVPSHPDVVSSPLHLPPTVYTPLQNEWLDDAHLEVWRQTAQLVLLDLLQNELRSPCVEALTKRVLERALQDDISNLELAGAVRWHKDKVDMRMMGAQEAPEVFRNMHRPDVQNQRDVRAVRQRVHSDLSFSIWEQHLDDPLSHSLLGAPVVVAVCDVYTSCA